MTSATRVAPRSTHTHTVYATFPGAPIQLSSGRRWIRIGSLAARRRAYGGELSNVPCLQTPCAGSQTWEPHRREREGERRREKSTGVDYLQVVCKKVHPSSPFIIGGGVPTSLPPPCGTKPHKGGWPARGMGLKGPWRPLLSPPFFSSKRKREKGSSPNGLLSKRRPVALLN